MTNVEILEDILTHYGNRIETQADIAKRYHVEQTYISDLLQECGFHNSRFTGGKSVDVNIAWQNPEVQRRCEEIRKSMQ